MEKTHKLIMCFRGFLPINHGGFALSLSNQHFLPVKLSPEVRTYERDSSLRDEENLFAVRAKSVDFH